MTHVRGKLGGFIQPAQTNQHPPATMVEWGLGTQQKTVSWPCTICRLWWVLVHFGCFIIDLKIQYTWCILEGNKIHDIMGEILFNGAWNITSVKRSLQLVMVHCWGALLGSPQGASLVCTYKTTSWWTGLTERPLEGSRVGVLDM
jgi:hypothetical protein